ncbi:Activating signal cointegrator 1 complex subunit 1 [Plecturocebus cupreus]
MTALFPVGETYRVLRTMDKGLNGPGRESLDQHCMDITHGFSARHPHQNQRKCPGMWFTPVISALWEAEDWPCPPQWTASAISKLGGAVVPAVQLVFKAGGVSSRPGQQQQWHFHQTSSHAQAAREVCSQLSITTTHSAGSQTGMQWNGTISAHRNLCLPGSSDSPASASGVAKITDIAGAVRQNLPARLIVLRLGFRKGHGAFICPVATEEDASDQSEHRKSVPQEAKMMSFGDTSQLVSLIPGPDGRSDLLSLSKLCKPFSIKFWTWAREESKGETVERWNPGCQENPCPKTDLRGLLDSGTPKYLTKKLQLKGCALNNSWRHITELVAKGTAVPATISKLPLLNWEATTPSASLRGVPLLLSSATLAQALIISQKPNSFGRSTCSAQAPSDSCGPWPSPTDVQCSLSQAPSWAFPSSAVLALSQRFQLLFSLWGWDWAQDIQSRTLRTEKRRAGQKSRAGDPGFSFAQNRDPDMNTESIHTVLPQRNLEEMQMNLRSPFLTLWLRTVTCSESVFPLLLQLAAASYSTTGSTKPGSLFSLVPQFPALCLRKKMYKESQAQEKVDNYITGKDAKL